MSGEPIRVLVVDDHHMFAEALVAYLRAAEDIRVVGIATTGTGALEAAAEHQPDVVLMDYRLPDADGVSVAERLKAEHPRTKVVVLTGHPEDSVLVRAIEAGCSGFITKHEAVDRVVAGVRAAHRGEALIDPRLLARLLPRLRGERRGLGADLTPRELEVLRLLAEGLSNRAIAERLALSVHTVRNYVQSLLGKLGAHSKLEAVATAVREGIIRLP